MSQSLTAHYLPARWAPVLPFGLSPMKHLTLLARSGAYRQACWWSLQAGLTWRAGAGATLYRKRPIAYHNWDVFMASWREIFVNQAYDFGDGAPAPYIVDVGANLGLEQIYWSLRYPGFTSVCFEPDPAIATVLRHNLKTWEIATDCHEAAVGGEEGVAGFRADGRAGGHLSRAGEDWTHAVRVEPLRPFLEREVDLLKIDVEGVEGDLLAAIDDCLPRVRRFFVECHSHPGQAQNHGNILAQLADHGFRTYVQTAYGPRHPFRTRPLNPSGRDQNLNIFAVR